MYATRSSTFADQHYESSYLFRDTLAVKILPPTAPTVRTRWQSQVAAPIGAGYQPLPLSIETPR
jgi:hypothetical protein